jgi:hypothetical protein
MPAVSEQRWAGYLGRIGRVAEIVFLVAMETIGAIVAI